MPLFEFLRVRIFPLFTARRIPLAEPRVKVFVVFVDVERRVTAAILQ